MNKSNQMDRIILDTKFRHIDYMIHISDVHIRKTERHDEYRIVFNRLNRRIAKILRMKPNTIIVITGDTMHDKTELVPTSVQLFKKFITNLASLTEVVITVGNHDVNIFSSRSLDCIEPMIYDLKTTNKIHLLKEDMMHNLGDTGITFGLTSIWTDRVTQITKQEAKHTYIALYHGIIHGSTLDNGMKALNDNRVTNSSYFTMSDFDGYDMVMLGDVHKHQYLNASKTIAYAGSLIQQKRDEELLEHGYILWNITNKTSKFYEVKSDYGMIQIDMDTNPTQYLKSIQSTQKCGRFLSKFSNDLLPKNLDVKLTYDSVESTKAFNRVYTALGKSRHLIKTTESMRSVKLVNSQSVLAMAAPDVIKTAKNVKSGKFDKSNRLDGDDDISKRSDTKACAKTESSGVLVDNNTVINAILEHYDKMYSKSDSNEPGQMTAKVTRNLIRKQVRIILKKIDYNYETDVKTIQLVSLEYDNMFIYLADNKVDFGMFDKIVGLNAPNYRGKSSFIDVILYSIYGKCSRGKRFDVLNVGKDSMKSRIVVNVNNIEYIILRTSYVASRKGRDLKESITVWENGIDITGDDRVKTHKIIEKKICSYSDMVNNSFVLQRNGCSFIDLTDRQKKDLLCKMARLDVFDRVFQEAKSMHFSYSQSLGRLTRQLDGYADQYVHDTDESKCSFSKHGAPRKIELIHSTMIGRHGLLSVRIEKLCNSIQSLRTELTSLYQTHSVRETERRYEERIDEEMRHAYDQYVLDRQTYDENSCTLIDMYDRFGAIRNSRDSVLAGRTVWKIRNDLSTYSQSLHMQIATLNSSILELHSALCSVRSKDIVLIEHEDQNKILNDMISKQAVLKSKQNQIDDRVRVIGKSRKCDDQIVSTFIRTDEYRQCIETLNEDVNRTELKLRDTKKLLHDLKDHDYDPDCPKCVANPVTQSILRNTDTVSTYECIIQTKKSEITVHEKTLRKLRTNALEKQIDINDRMQYERALDNPQALRTAEQEYIMICKDIEVCDLRTDSVNSAILSLETELHHIEENNTLYDRIQSGHTEIAELQEKLIVSKLVDELRRIDESNSELAMMNREIDVVRKRLAVYAKRMEDYECRSSTYDREIRIIESQYGDAMIRDEINAIDEQIHSVEFILSKKQSLYQKLVTKKNSVEIDIGIFAEIKSSIERDSKYQFIMSCIKGLLDKSGLVDLLLTKRIIPYLECRINQILTNVGHYQVKIEYRNQSVNIYKSDASSQTDLNICMSSGYESYLLDLVFRLSLSMINNHIRTNFLIIDEGFNACDAEHKENIRELLEYMRSYYSWILIVSHDAYIKSFYDHSIEIDQITQISDVPYCGSQIVCYRKPKIVKAVKSIKTTKAIRTASTAKATKAIRGTKTSKLIRA